MADRRDWLPGIHGLAISHHAFYEMGGLAVRLLTPRSGPDGDPR